MAGFITFQISEFRTSYFFICRSCAEKQDRKTARGRWESKSQPKMRGKKYQQKNVDMKTRCFFQSTQRYSGEKMACRLSREIEVMCFLGFEKGLPYGFSQRKPRFSQLFGQRKRETEMISTRTAHLLQVNHPLSYWSNNPLAVPKEADFFHPPFNHTLPKDSESQCNSQLNLPRLPTQPSTPKNHLLSRA